MYAGWTKVFVVAGFMSAATPVWADGFGFNFSYLGGHRHRHGVNVGVMIGRPAPLIGPAPVIAPAPVVVPPAPVVVTPPVVVSPIIVQTRPVWVPPVYRTVSERVWVPTTTTTYRDVPVIDRYGNVVSYRREAHTVPSGYWSVVQRQVLVRAGYWTTTVESVTSPRIVPAPQEMGEPGPEAQPYEGEDGEGFEGDRPDGVEPEAPRSYRGTGSPSQEFERGTRAALIR